MSNDTDYSAQSWNNGDLTTPIDQTRLRHIESGIKHHNHPAITDADAEAGSLDGLFWDITEGDGHQVLRVKLGADAIVEWDLNPDGSLATPAGFSVWPVIGVPANVVGAQYDWAISDNGLLYFKDYDAGATPTLRWLAITSRASADYAVAEGKGSDAFIVASHAWAGGVLTNPYLTGTTLAEGIRVPLAPLATSDGTAHTLLNAAGATLDLLKEGVWGIQGFVVARRVDIAGINGEASYWRFDALVESHVGASPYLRLVGSSVSMVYQDSAASTWAVTVDTHGGTDLRVRVQGQAAKTINWVCSFEGGFVQ